MFAEASEYVYDKLNQEDLPKFVISKMYQKVKAPNLVESKFFVQKKKRIWFSWKKKKVSAPSKVVCAQCMKEIADNQDPVTIGDFLYHWNCMQCSVCGKKQVDSNTCVIRGRQLTCADCEV